MESYPAVNCPIKEFRHSIQLQRIEVRFSIDRLRSKKLGTYDSVTLELTSRFSFTGNPFVVKYGAWIFNSLMGKLCMFTFPLTWNVASSEKQTLIRNVSP